MLSLNGQKIKKRRVLMRVCDVWVKNYRNLKSEHIEFSERFNVIYGENAQGKTNIIEAIWLLTGTRSFRGAKDKDLVAFGENFAEVTGKIFCGERDNAVKIKIADGKRIAQINGLDRGAAPSIIGTFKMVIFSPEHLSLVKGGPENRRKFIDAAICQLKPTYPALLVRYNKTLRQRNALLKDISRGLQHEYCIDIWDVKLSEYAGAIISERKKYVDALNKNANLLYNGLSGGEVFEIKYSEDKNFYLKNTKEISEIILNSLKNHRNSDIARGFTSIGPHRDDLHMEINGKSAKEFGSQGQQRSAVIALKLAEAEIVGQNTGEMPIILLDDILSELDEKRQEYLFRNTVKAQVIITGCVKPRIINNCRCFEVNNGRILSEG